MAKVVKAAKPSKAPFPKSLAKKRALGKDQRGKDPKKGLPVTATKESERGMGLLMKSGSEHKKTKKLARMKKGAKINVGKRSSA